MKTALFNTGYQLQSELNNTPGGSQPVSTLQGKKNSSLISGLQKQAGNIRTAFNTIISSAITYKSVDNRYRSGYSGRSYR